MALVRNDTDGNGVHTTSPSSLSPASSSSLSLDALLEQERERNEQLTQRVSDLEKRNNVLLDDISILKRKTLKQKLNKETESADTRRKLANLQVELGTSQRHVAFLEKEVERNVSPKNDASLSAPSSSGERVDYQQHIKDLHEENQKLQKELDVTYERNNNQSKLLRRLETEMNKARKELETKINKLQKQLIDERTKAFRLQQQVSPKGGGVAGFNNSFSSVSSPATSPLATRTLSSSIPPGLPIDLSFNQTAPVQSEDTSILSQAGGSQNRNTKSQYRRQNDGRSSRSLSPVRNTSSTSIQSRSGRWLGSANGRNTSRLARVESNRNVMMRQQNQLMSLRELRDSRRAQQSEGLDERQRAMIDVTTNAHGGRSDPKTTPSGRQSWNPDILPGGGAIQETSQSSFIDAIVQKKKEEENGFWGKLFGGSGGEGGDDNNNNDTATSTDMYIDGPDTEAPLLFAQTSSGDGSLLTKEIMFSIKENDRMMEEREKVRKSQEAARKIWGKEQEKVKAKQHVKQMKSAVKWGVFTMFSSITEDDDGKNDNDGDYEHDSNGGNVETNNNRISNTSSIDTQELRRLAAKRTAGLSEEDLGLRHNANITLDHEVHMNRLSAVSTLTIPESLIEPADEEEKET